ncbi:MAG: agmatine/peptidylarginine deiminase [Halochromatium sp.]|uniref:agmatine deiminase family protein n=1 Tax=Halochromatium sp. TaxID=2049430 RepID=UPI00397B34A1
MQRLPAEWEPQAAIMLTWPHPGTDWARQLDAVERVYQRLVPLIGRDQEVLIVCRDAPHRAAIQAQLSASSVARIRFAIAPSNDTWARDHGPISVIDGASGQRCLIDFRFDGWGGKYPAALDDRITATVFAGDECLESSALVLEGGAIESDGAGSLLAVRRTLVDPQRNPGWSQAAIEDELRIRLGIERFLWLEHGQLSGDDTDGHIDTLARFCDARTIGYAASSDPADADHPVLEQLAAELRRLRQRNGEPYRLVALPQPAPIHDDDGQRLPAGYANFLITNRSVLVPVYADPADAIACERLASCFPGRRIEPVDCRPLIRQGGSLHCITMQLAANR